MIQLSDFKVGQEVVISGDRRFPEGRKTTVIKIGRKYVTVDGVWRERQFYADNREDYFVEKIEYGAPSVLYPSEEAYRYAMERARLREKMRRFFDWSNRTKLTLEQLQRIDAIIEESATPPQNQ